MKPALDGRRATRDLARLYGSPPDKYDDALIVRSDQGVQVADRHTLKRNGTTGRLPSNWRGRLPMPSSWYVLNVPEMVVHNHVGTAPCPMHPDRGRSFSVNLAGSKGVWSCPVCGHGDMVGFVMRRFGMKFLDAVRRLVLGRNA